MDTVTKEKRSEIMSKIKSKSSIEVLPASFTGMRLRKHPNIFGRPDFGNKSRKIAVFIDGCFWHCCPKHYRRPKSNTEFWDNKARTNKARDRKVSRELRKQGYSVTRIWEHDLKTKRKKRTSMCLCSGGIETKI